MGKLGVKDLPIKVGIIGMGYGVSTLLPAIRARDEYAVISIAGSGDPRVSADYPRLIKMGINPATSQEIINSGEIDLVVIASPPATQEFYAISALKHGKNIYCEKPVGLDAGAARRIYQAANSSKKVATVGYQFRYDPSILWLKKRVAGGSLGQVRRVEILWETSGATRTRSLSWRNHREQGGGVLRDFASHVFDYMSIIDPLNFSHEKGDFNAKQHAFKSNKAGLDIQEIDISAQFGVAQFHCSISRNASRPRGHRITIEGAHGGVQITHKVPFGIDDIFAENWIGTRGERVETTNELDLKHVFEESRRFNLDMRQLAVRNLFGDLALRLSGVSSPLLPNLDQAIANQLLVDEAKEALYSE